jgi:two-component system NtrC family sensor kinase
MSGLLGVRGMKILLADDSSFIRKHFSNILSELGHTVVTASDGSSALQAIYEDPSLRLAILDWEMPGLSGPEVCTKIRDAHIGRYIYTILLTGQQIDDDVVIGMRAGADDFIRKQVSIPELEVRLKAGERIVTLHQERDQLLSETQQLIKGMPSICMSTDARFRITTWNPTCEKVFGYAQKEVLHKKHLHEILPCDWERIEEGIFQSRATNLPVHLDEIHCTLGSKENRILEMTLTNLPQHDQSETGLLIIGKDITNRRKLEESMKKKHRLESIGHLAAGIAHEVNTPIQYVRDNTQFLLNEFQHLARLITHYRTLTTQFVAPNVKSEIDALEDELEIDYLLEEIPTALAQTIEGTEAVAHIVRSMKEFSHPGSSAKIDIDLNRAIESVLTISRSEWKYVAEIEMDLQEDLPFLSCYPAEINQPSLISL